MQTVDERFRLAETYRAIQQEIDEELEVEYIHHTNALEGSKFTLWATRKVLKGIPFKKRLKFKDNDILAVQSQQRAIKFIRDMASIHNYNLSERDIKHIHSMLPEYLVAGEYRTDDTGLTVPSSEIPRHMSELIDFINNIKKHYKFKPIEQATCIHYQFTRISPFLNFNGSVARLLMNYILIKNGYPLTVIRANDEKEYLGSLNSEDSIYFLQFVTQCVLETERAYSGRTKEHLISIGLKQN
jgi:Fic family protein